MELNRVKHSKCYMLKGALKKNGFDRWRLVMNGFSANTGEECTFFIEFYIVNPLLSPSECVLGFKTRLEPPAADLQAMLAGTEDEKKILSEEIVQPSYVLVKAGRLSRNGKQINRYYPCSSIKTQIPDCIIKVGSTEENTCIITDNSTFGSVSVSRADLIETPELMSDVGTMSWNLRYDAVSSFFPNYRDKCCHWSCFGAQTKFEGVILFDGEKFVVNSNTSYGYFDKNWGKNFTTPFLHLSSCNLTSNISGKKLVSSCFAVQGEYNKRLSILSSFEDFRMEFHAGSHRKFDVHYECTEMPPDDDGVKLHWSISMNDRKNVVDIDIFCPTDTMFVRDYECPDGGRKMMKVIGGGVGTGELKLYHRIKKNLELIEDVHVANCLCEYGNIEEPEL